MSIVILNILNIPEGVYYYELSYIVAMYSGFMEHAGYMQGTYIPPRTMWDYATMREGYDKWKDSENLASRFYLRYRMYGRTEVIQRLTTSFVPEPDTEFNWNITTNAFWQEPVQPPPPPPPLPPPPPVADFTWEEVSPLVVQFTNLSEAITSQEWDFGDGNRSNEPNPQHTYPDSGDYVVSLTVYSNSDWGLETKIVTVTAEPLPPPPPPPTPPPPVGISKLLPIAGILASFISLSKPTLTSADKLISAVGITASVISLAVRGKKVEQ